VPSILEDLHHRGPPGRRAVERLRAGADDNASGSVAVLEAAKILSCYAFKNTVRFLTVTGEEQGLLGSGHYAADAYTPAKTSRAYSTSTCRGGRGTACPHGREPGRELQHQLQELGLFFAQCATDYATGLPVDAFLCLAQRLRPLPFWQKGYRAICGITDNEGYCSHAALLLLPHVQRQHLEQRQPERHPHIFLQVVRTAVAAIAELGEPFKILLDSPLTPAPPRYRRPWGQGAQRDPTSQKPRRSRSTAPPSHTGDLLLTEESANSTIFRGASPSPRTHRRTATGAQRRPGTRSPPPTSMPGLRRATNVGYRSRRGGLHGAGHLRRAGQQRHGQQRRHHLDHERERRHTVFYDTAKPPRPTAPTWPRR